MSKTYGKTMKALRRLFFAVFKCYRRVELRRLRFGDAHRLLQENAGWQIARPEEDRNRVAGIVYLERRERILS